jgi:hypothetical protein
MLRLAKMTFLTRCQVEDLVKMDNCPSKWSWLNQIGHIGHIEWIWFSQIDHHDLNLSQIEHYDLTFSQMNHVHFDDLAYLLT